MIEFCNRKRMAIAILVLVGLSILVLVFENNITVSHNMKDVTQPPGNSSKHCWDYAKVAVIEACTPCSLFEQKVQDYCKPTNYKEKVKCVLKKGNKEVYRSCPKLSWVEERNFWIFESVHVLLGIGAYGVVLIRQKRLDRLLLEKVHKQIASGV